jgi:hypothetical protein
MAHLIWKIKIVKLYLASECRDQPLLSRSKVEAALWLATALSHCAYASDIGELT